MAALTDHFDLGSLRLGAGEGRRLELAVAIEPLALGGRALCRRAAARAGAAGSLAHGRATGTRCGCASRRALRGPCMRCLKAAAPEVEVDAREVDVPEAARSSTVRTCTEETLDLAAWARDAFVLALPVQVLCREDCAGLCPVCAVDLNEAGPEHHHEREPDPRWAKLRELKLE